MVSLIHLTSDSHDDSHLCNSAAGPVDDYHLVEEVSEDMTMKENMTQDWQELIH